MSLFICAKCNCIDNTAMPGNTFYLDGDSQLCTECYSGKWHGKFPKMTKKEFIKKYPKTKFVDKRNMKEY